MWSEVGALRIQVRDVGRAGIAGAVALAAGGAGADGWPYQPGHGLRLVRQVTDEMSVLTGPGGSTVTLAFALPAAGDGKEPGGR